MLLMLAACGLAGYVVAGWLRAGMPGDPVRAGILPGLAAGAGGILVLAGLLLGGAAALFWRSRAGRLEPGMRDPLTGLFTPSYVAETLPGLMARDDRAGCSQLALVRVRVDCVADIRRRYGSAAADRVLGAVGRHIRTQTRGSDMPRQPDEHGFAVFLHCQELEQAQAFCRRLSTLLRSEQLDWHGDVIKVAPSMGIAIRQPGESLDALDGRARQALAARPAEATGQPSA